MSRQSSLADLAGLATGAPDGAHRNITINVATVHIHPVAGDTSHPLRKRSRGESLVEEDDCPRCQIHLGVIQEQSDRIKRLEDQLNAVKQSDRPGSSDGTGEQGAEKRLLVTIRHDDPRSPAFRHAWEQWSTTTAWRPPRALELAHRIRLSGRLETTPAVSDHSIEVDPTPSPVEAKFPFTNVDILPLLTAIVQGQVCSPVPFLRLLFAAKIMKTAPNPTSLFTLQIAPKSPGHLLAEDRLALEKAHIDLTAPSCHAFAFGNSWGLLDISPSDKERGTLRLYHPGLSPASSKHIMTVLLRSNLRRHLGGGEDEVEDNMGRWNLHTMSLISADDPMALAAILCVTTYVINAANSHSTDLSAGLTDLGFSDEDLSSMTPVTLNANGRKRLVGLWTHFCIQCRDWGKAVYAHVREHGCTDS